MAFAMVIRYIVICYHIEVPHKFLPAFQVYDKENVLLSGQSTAVKPIINLKILLFSRCYKILGNLISALIATFIF